jgi:hypothetical protein
MTMRSATLRLFLPALLGAGVGITLVGCTARGTAEGIQQGMNNACGEISKASKKIADAIRK